MPIAALRLERVRPCGAPAVALSGVPWVGYFHPRQPACVMVCAAAAEAWQATTANTASTLDDLHRSGTAALIIASNGVDCPGFLGALATFPGSAWRSPFSESAIVAQLRDGALRRMREAAAERTVHGVFLSVHGLGVLLTGRSGCGKSELALELLARGHRLVADDAVELLRTRGGWLLGRCPSLLSGFIEVRGLGILDATALYGPEAISASIRLDLIVELDAATTENSTARLHGNRTRQRILGAVVDRLSLPRRVGHNSAAWIEAACRDHWTRLAGYRADAAFIERQQRGIASAAPNLP